MSFYTSLSGLQASQTDMSTISNNLANSATSGFKRSTTEFADVMASSLAVSPNHMIGSGVAVKDTRQQFSEGNLIQSQSSLDLAITGDGFFATKAQVDGTAVKFNSMDLALANAAKHKLVGLLAARLESEGVYVGEVMIAGTIKGTAWDQGNANIDPKTAADKFWSLYQDRKEIRARIS